MVENASWDRRPLDTEMVLKPDKSRSNNFFNDKKFNGCNSTNCVVVGHHANRVPKCSSFHNLTSFILTPNNNCHDKTPQETPGCKITFGSDTADRWRIHLCWNKRNAKAQITRQLTFLQNLDKMHLLDWCWFLNHDQLSTANGLLLPPFLFFTIMITDKPLTKNSC